MGVQVVVASAALVVLLAGLRAAGPLVVPLVLSAFLAMLSAPAVVWLQKRRVPEGLAVVLVLLVVIAAFAGFVGFVGGSINRFVLAAPRYQVRLEQMLGGLSETLQGYGVALGFEELRALVDPGAAFALAGEVLRQLASVLSDAVLVILTLAFMLLEVAYLPGKLSRITKRDDADIERLSKLVQEVNSYVAIKTYVSIATGVLVGVALALLGVDFPILWGLLAFVLNYVPNIGSVIAAVPPVLLALVQFGLGRAAAVAGLFIAINMIVGNVVEPRIMGRRLGLSTLVVFLSLIFWGWMWGPLGMLLSVPLTMVVKILLERSGQLPWLVVLMDAGGKPEPDAPSRE